VAEATTKRNGVATIRSLRLLRYADATLRGEATTSRFATKTKTKTKRGQRGCTKTKNKNKDCLQFTVYRLSVIGYRLQDSGARTAELYKNKKKNKNKDKNKNDNQNKNINKDKKGENHEFAIKKCGNIAKIRCLLILFYRKCLNL